MGTFAKSPGSLQRPVPKSRRAEGDATTSKPKRSRRPNGPWGSYLMTIREEEAGRLEGPGVTPERLIEEARGDYRAGFDQHVASGRDPAAYRAGAGHLVIWSGLEVVAILRPMLDGSLAVERFDVVRATS